MSFEILPIPENLRREELIVQLADRLQKLEIFNETIFNRVEQKLTDLQKTICDINQRANVCHQKVQFIQQDNKKATVLYSHPKFPIDDSEIRQYFNSLFEDEEYSFNEQLKKKLFAKNLNSSNFSQKKINSTHVPFDDDANVKSHFVIYDRKFSTKFIPEVLSEEFVPWNQLTSLSSLLLFNTSLNAYNVSNRTQALEQKQKNKKKNKEEEEENTIDNVSSAVTQTPVIENEDLRIKFSFQSAPELIADLPSALPSLAGLADEFQFQDEEDSLYSLEINSFKNLPDLAHISSKSPKHAPTKYLKNTKKFTDLFEDESPVSTLPNFSASKSPPPPPPPPPAAVPSLPQLPSLVTEEISKPPVIPPPPPPPALILESISKPSTSSVSVASSSNRASLLESIRQAGGRPKKITIKEKKQEEKLKKKQEQNNNLSVSLNKNFEEMDMLSELKNRLNSRRAGISAEPKKVLTQTAPYSVPSTGFNVIDSMRNSIPEPQSKSGSSSENDSEIEDWMD